MIIFYSPDVGNPVVQARDCRSRSQPHDHDADSIKILNSHGRLVKLIGRNRFKG
jgi:hypothetical protein